MSALAPTDEELVLAFQAGDAGAFDILTGRWQRKIQGAIHRVVGSSDEARDLSQETFLKAYRALGRFKRDARFSSWLYQIALNVCRDRLRRRKARPSVSLEGLEANGFEPPRAAGPSALESLEAQERAGAVARAMATLPAEQREVVVLKEYEGLTFVEVAQTLGVPVSTVKTRLYRGLDQLRQRLQPPA